MKTRTHQTRSPRYLAFGVTLAIIAVACSADSESTPAPAPDATTAPAASPTETASPQPVTGGGLTGTTTTTTAGAAPELTDLVNADGSSFALTDYAGENTLVFFGYTHCPDVCPATIGELFGVFKELPETQAVFISVDPERDTPEFLEEWTQYFPDQFNAVTGSPGAIRRAADNYGVKYARVETTSTSGYTMSHTADTFLIDGDGQLQTAYPFGTTAAEIVADLDQRTAG